MPASVLVDLDGIEGGISGEGFPRHLSHEVIAPFARSEKDPELPCINPSVTLNECHSGLSGSWW